MLYLVPTPVGNLEDITFRSLQILSKVQLILCEDTRVAKKLLNHYKINTPVSSFHAHNEHQKIKSIIDKLVEGMDIALITDAGTPGISDPGYLLVNHAKDREIVVSALPGATAFVPALVASGLPCDRFHFEGFLPQKKGRQTRWKFLVQYPHTIVIYESPYRLMKCLLEIQSHFVNRKVCVAREISKLYEDIFTGSISEVLDYYKNKGKIKGEIVVVIGPKIV